MIAEPHGSTVASVHQGLRDRIRSERLLPAFQQYTAPMSGHDPFSLSEHPLEHGPYRADCPARELTSSGPLGQDPDTHSFPLAA
jgi:hypothetical protein